MALNQIRVPMMRNLHPTREDRVNDKYYGGNEGGVGPQYAPVQHNNIALSTTTQGSPVCCLTIHNITVPFPYKEPLKRLTWEAIEKAAATHSRRFSQVTGVERPPGLSSTLVSSSDSVVKFSRTISGNIDGVTPISDVHHRVALLISGRDCTINRGKLWNTAVHNTGKT